LGAARFGGRWCTITLSAWGRGDVRASVTRGERERRQSGIVSPGKEAAEGAHGLRCATRSSSGGGGSASSRRKKTPWAKMGHKAERCWA
jgi:hypothetical protein